MAHVERTFSGLEVVHNQIEVVGRFPMGCPGLQGIGPGYEPKTPGDIHKIAAQAGEATRPLTVTKAAYCIDERAIIQLGKIDDPQELERIVAPHLPGGTFLAAAKAAVIANIAAVHSANDFIEAYNIVSDKLKGMDYEDAAHAGCGASKMAEQSTREPIAHEAAFGLSQHIGVAQDGEQGIFQALYTNMRSIPEGFFSSWSAAQHEQRVQRTYPQHFAILRTEDDATHGHHGSGLYLLAESGMGFAKNAFIKNSDGLQLFAYTHAFARELAQKLGGSAEERRAVELAMVYDLLNVGNQLFAAPAGEPGEAGYYPGMAVFQQRA
jgi:hypothetical protein